MISDNPIKYQLNQSVHPIQTHIFSAQTRVLSGSFFPFQTSNPKKKNTVAPLTSAPPAGSSGGFRSDPPAARTAHRFAPRTLRGRWRSRCRPGTTVVAQGSGEAARGSSTFHGKDQLFREPNENKTWWNPDPSHFSVNLYEFIIFIYIYPFNKSNIISEITIITGKSGNQWDFKCPWDCLGMVASIALVGCHFFFTYLTGHQLKGKNPCRARYSVMSTLD